MSPSRPHFFEGQYLSAADLAAVVEHAHEARARILLGAHRWGIALGMDLREVPGPNGTLDVVLQPGYAWDGFGRPIVVAEPAKVSPSLFAALDAAVPAGAPPGPPTDVDVWVRYDEVTGPGPRPGFATCAPGEDHARVTERFALEAGARPELASRRDPVLVAGRSVDAAQALRALDPAAPELVDASIPHQELPALGEPARWLVPVGTVRYQPGSPGTLVAAEDSTRSRSARIRQYAGVVAGSVEAAGGQVRVHDRTRPYSPASSEELLSVEGDLRVDGDTRLYGGHLDLVASHAEDPRLPIQVRRSDDPGAGRTALTLVIGDGAAGANRLVVARRSGTDPAGRDQHEARMVVTDQGRVGIGTEEPRAPLHLGAQGVQVGASATATDNFHVESVDGPRALRFSGGDAGAGTPLMSLTATGRLGLGTTDPSHPVHVASPLGVRAGSLHLGGDARWSSVSFNSHHNEANTAWVFPDPTRPAATIEMDAAGGFPRFEVFTTQPGNNQAWISRIFLNGHTGNVGIGTTTPSARLEVAGDLRFAGLAAVGSDLGLRLVWGAVGPSGGIQAGSGFTVSRPGGSGRYTVAFTNPFAGQPTMIVTRVHETLANNDGTAVTASETAVVDQLLVDRCVVATADKNGTRVDGGFTFLAIGPR